MLATLGSIASQGGVLVGLFNAIYSTTTSCFVKTMTKAGAEISTIAVTTQNNGGVVSADAPPSTNPSLYFMDSTLDIKKMNYLTGAISPIGDTADLAGGNAYLNTYEDTDTVISTKSTSYVHNTSIATGTSRGSVAIAGQPYTCRDKDRVYWLEASYSGGNYTPHKRLISNMGLVSTYSAFSGSAPIPLGIVGGSVFYKAGGDIQKDGTVIIPASSISGGQVQGACMSETNIYVMAFNTTTKLLNLYVFTLTGALVSTTTVMNFSATLTTSLFPNITINGNDLFMAGPEVNNSVNRQRYLRFDATSKALLSDVVLETSNNSISNKLHVTKEF